MQKIYSLSYKIKSIPKFEKELKRLAKKYSSFKNESLQLIQSLKEGPLQGTSPGNNCSKVRLAIASKGEGKSGGARVLAAVYAPHLFSIRFKKNVEQALSKGIRHPIFKVGGIFNRKHLCLQVTGYT
jgi:mRNA-degrading endonuclease RelE of RelBE toxin-antitoxin system